MNIIERYNDLRENVNYYDLQATKSAFGNLYYIANLRKTFALPTRLLKLCKDNGIENCYLDYSRKSIVFHTVRECHKAIYIINKYLYKRDYR